MNRYRAIARARGIVAVAWIAAAFVFLFAPLVVVVGASFDGGNRTFMNFPPQEFSTRWYFLIAPDLFHSLALAIGLGLTTAFLACILGVPAALGLVRAEFRGKAVVAALFRAPLQIPAVVIGVSFLKLYYLIGDIFGLRLVGTLPGLLIAHLFLATPYVIGSVVAVLQRFNLRLEEAALSLGASRIRTFRRVTLPLIMPGVYAGAMYAFLVSFGDVPVSLFLGGPGMQPFAAKIFNLMEYDFDPSLLAISTYIIVGSFTAIYFLQRAIGLDQLTRSGGA